MKPFNLELAKQSKPVCTRDGRPVRIICFDRISPKYPIIALVSNADEREYTIEYKLNGKYHEEDDVISHNDLFMVSETKIAWMNVYKEGKEYFGQRIYDSQEEALDSRTEYCIDTIQIEFEV